MSSKVLITAFDAFGGEANNPAYDALKALSLNVENVEIVKLFVPTVFGKSSKAVIEAIKNHKPDSVICLGLAGGRSGITPERIAINAEDASIPDNEGNMPNDMPVISGAPDAYFSTLPIKSIVAEIRALGIEASVSNTAGTFVCNHLFYSVMHYLKSNGLGTLAGFIHVPYTPEMAKENTPSLPLGDIIKAVEIAVIETVKATPMPL